jgi:hypothetical protein
LFFFSVSKFDESHRKLRRRSSSPFDDYAHHHDRGDDHHGFQTFPKREPHWVETEYRSSQLHQYSCEVDLPYMDSAEPNLDPETEGANDSDSKDARLNPANYVVRIAPDVQGRILTGGGSVVRRVTVRPDMGVHGGRWVR